MEKDQRRRQLMDHALDIFAKKGFHSTSVSDIISAAQIARGTFYLYFPSKRSIFDEILNEMFIKILAQMKAIEIPTPFNAEIIKQQLRSNLQRLLSLFLTTPQYAKLLVSEAVGLDEEFDIKLSTFYKRLHDWIKSSLEYGIEMGISRQSYVDTAALVILGTIKEILYSWSVGKMQLNPEEVIEELIVFAQKGVLILTPKSS